MPRNGQGVYSLPPVYEAVTGETIEAQQHNVPLEDIASDLNFPRSVATGGTGGASAAQARDNLDVYSKSETDAALLEKLKNAPTKDTPVDADGVVITDSADSGKSKRVLWSRVKEVLASTFLTLTGGRISGPLEIRPGTAWTQQLLMTLGWSTGFKAFHFQMEADGSLSIYAFNPNTGTLNKWILGIQNDGAMISINTPLRVEGDKGVIHSGNIGSQSVSYAATAGSAGSATNATNAVNAGHATSADSAANATNATNSVNANNASNLGGVAPSGYQRSGILLNQAVGAWNAGDVGSTAYMHCTLTSVEPGQNVDGASLRYSGSGASTDWGVTGTWKCCGRLQAAGQTAFRRLL